MRQLADSNHSRLPNFNAGPAVMPVSVLEAIQNDLLDYQGRGLSVLEMSHRSVEFVEIADKAEQNLRHLLAIPDNYRVLFMQGGASSQFALTVQNLDTQLSVAYANTGHWSAKAMATGESLTQVVQVTQCQRNPLTSIPDSREWASSEQCSFLHITDNETIDGVVFDSIPHSEVPLVCDMSSSILSQPIDVSRYGLIYAGAQKNIGPAGITLIIVRDDLLERSASMNLPPVFNYAAMDKTGSMLNTPPTFAWYAAGLVFEWLIKEGGLDVIATRNKQQAELVYTAIDEHEIYTNSVNPSNRSRMNIPFFLPDAACTDRFLLGAKQRGFLGLKGHKSIGGVRASLYNAATDDSVDQLLDYLNVFAREHA